MYAATGHAVEDTARRNCGHAARQVNEGRRYVDSLLAGGELDFQCSRGCQCRRAFAFERYRLT